MHYAGGMSFFKRARDLGCDIEYLGDLEVRGHRFAPQCQPIDVLGGDVVAPAVNADFVNGKDVWMIEVRSGRRFLLETMQAIFVGRELLAQNLDRHLATKLRIFRQIDFTHPAGAESFENPVM